MLGYVVINKDELTEEEKRIYNAYYCGVCKSIGKRHGTIPRIVLSYDIVFLALISDAIQNEQDVISHEHCIIHPIAKKPVKKSWEKSSGKGVINSLDYAADMLLILAYHNFLDDIEDEHRIRGVIGTSVLEGTYGKLRKIYPEISDGVSVNIQVLNDLEREKSGDLDKCAAAFGETLRTVFSGTDESSNRILGELGFNLGRWIYVMDALDDLQNDEKKGTFNPLIYRERGTDDLENLLMTYLGNVMSAVDLLDIKKNKSIIENIVMLGLRGKTEELLAKLSQDEASD